MCVCISFRIYACNVKKSKIRDIIVLVHFKDTHVIIIIVIIPTLKFKVYSSKIENVHHLSNNKLHQNTMYK